MGLGLGKGAAGGSPRCKAGMDLDWAGSCLGLLGRP